MLHTDKNHSVQYAEALLKAHLNQPEEEKIKLEAAGSQMFEALFPGTHGGNFKYMYELMAMAVEGNVDFRNKYFPNDPDYVDKNIQESEAFKETMASMTLEYYLLIKQLKQSGTFFSMRTIGHMLWDTTLPGILGYFAALMYNQNNVAAEASPVTTLFEMHVGNELCKLLGYAVNPIGKKPGEFELATGQVTGWGHITCDGSVANLEGLWMARNLKFYATSVKQAILNEPLFQNAKNFQVTLLNGNKATLINLDSWTLLNIPIEEVLAIPNNLASPPYNLKPADISNAIAGYTVQNIGYHDILSKYLPDIKETPVSIASSTRHYSWPKGAAILGIGASNMWSVHVDLKARMDTTKLDNLLSYCVSQKIPVMNVVAVIGTTEESQVDPLKDILALRDKYRKQGLEFCIHADAAWGGYYKSMLNSANENNPATFHLVEDDVIVSLPMSSYVTEQYKVLQLADSITIDPHKSGYVPYPAGGLCYRNSAMRNLVSFTAPVVYHGGVDPTVGVYGVEGSKPGAAASAVYFSHKVIRPNINGYGKLSGECFFNAKRLYAALVCLNIQPGLNFFVVPLIPIPAIQQGLPPAQVQQQYEFIRDRIVNVSNQQLLNDPQAFALFKELGGDQTIITYMFNYFTSGTTPNSKMKKVNDLNNAIYTKFSFKPYEVGTENTPIVVTSSQFTRSNNGDLLLNSLRQRLGVATGDGINDPINFIISTIMNPWLSNTVKGSFIPTLMNIMVQNITQIVAEIKAQP
ncbi:MAG: decarboxylase [Sphingobacteriales bacterium]|nr:decarboxylase [Sphingobacteriales bacterium]MBI3720103.1 decarboxylase [Sphingobacteriales bacterium]